MIKNPEIIALGPKPCQVSDISNQRVNGEHTKVGQGDKGGYLKQMGELGFSFQEVSRLGEKVTLLNWPGRDDDFALFRAIGVVLDDIEIEFSRFRQYLYATPEMPMTFQSLIQKSRLFANLCQKNGYKNQAESMPNIEHILKVLELFQEGSAHRRLERWFVFMHDLGKSIPWRDVFHARGSTMIGQTYFYYENQQARREGKEEPFSEEFLEDFSALCELHHIFEFMLNDYANPQVLRVVNKLAEQGNCSRDLFLEAMSRLFIRNKGKTFIDFSRFFVDFPVFLEKPYLLGILLRFTRADVSSYEGYFDNPLYAKGRLYQAANDVFMDEIKQYMESKGMSLD